MLERGKMDRNVIEMVGIDSLVPEEHLLRKIDRAVDFSRLYEMVEPLYSEDNGRPSVDPVVLFKVFAQFSSTHVHEKMCKFLNMQQSVYMVSVKKKSGLRGYNIMEGREKDKGGWEKWQRERHSMRRGLRSGRSK